MAQLPWDRLGCLKEVATTLRVQSTQIEESYLTPYCTSAKGLMVPVDGIWGAP